MIKDELNVNGTQYTQQGSIGGSKFVWLKGCWTQRVMNGATILNYPGAGGYVPSASLAQFVYKEYGNSVQNACNIAYAFKVATIAGDTDTAIDVVKAVDGFVPTVGMILGKCPATLAGTTIGATITKVVAGADKYTLTFSAALGALAVTDYLVEVVEAGSEKALVITNPNTFVGEEMYFAAAGIVGVTLGADPYSTPLYLHNTALKRGMPDYPAIFINAVNRSKIEGVIEI